MTVRLTVTARNAMLGGSGALKDLLAGGSIEIYTGAQPATVGNAPAGTKLSTNALSAIAFGTPSNGSMTANAITNDSSADASGTAGCFVIKDSSNTIQLDGAIALTTGGDINFDNITFVQGGVVSITSLVLTVPISV